MVDVSTVNAAANSQQAGLSGAARADLQGVRNSKVDEQPVRIPAVEETEIRADSEDRRFNRVLETAQRIVKEYYPISDTRFTIFKDGSGQYITRFTNLRDGTVTFYPEPDLLNMLGRRGGDISATFETNA